MSVEASAYPITFPERLLIRKERLIPGFDNEFKLVYCKVYKNPAWIFFDLLPEPSPTEEEDIRLRRILQEDRPDETLVSMISLEAYRLIEFSTYRTKFAIVDFTKPEDFESYRSTTTRLLEYGAPPIYTSIDDSCQLLLGLRTSCLETLYAHRGATYHQELVEIKNKNGQPNLSGGEIPSSNFGLISYLMDQIFKQEYFDTDTILTVAIELKERLKVEVLPKTKTGGYDIEMFYKFPHNKNFSFTGIEIIMNHITPLPQPNQEMFMNQLLSEPAELRWSTLQDMKEVAEKISQTKPRSYYPVDYQRTS